MKRLSINAFGLAVGTTGALLYLGCMLVMTLLGEDLTIAFFNSLLHGLDVTYVIRMDIPLWEAGLGVVQTFILGWLSGACVAGIYNFSASTE
jgi:hypothetical protein